jgi:group I intron endonuclease
MKYIRIEVYLVNKKLNCGIYKITNTINGKFYIGQSVRLNGRKYNHFYSLRNGDHHSKHLQNAFNKYGEEVFIFNILLYCEPEELTYYEQKLVDLWNPEYNARKECVNNSLGCSASEETKIKMSESQSKRSSLTYFRSNNKLIFDEKKEAKRILKDGFTFYMSNKELDILAKYFRYLEKDDEQIKSSLIKFCRRYNIEYDERKFKNKINFAIKNTKKFSLRLFTPINISESEMESIRNFKDYKYQKILFVMIAIAKYFKYSDIECNLRNNIIYDNKFFINEYFTKILKIAKVNIDKKEKEKILCNLINSGLICQISENKFEIMFVDEKSPTSIIITNADKIIDFLPFYCEKCGKKIKNKSKMHNLCEKCYKEKRKRKAKEYMYSVRHANGLEDGNIIKTKFVSKRKTNS